MSDHLNASAIAEFDRLAEELDPLAKAKELIVNRSTGRLSIESIAGGVSPDIAVWSIYRVIAARDVARNAWVVTEETDDGDTHAGSRTNAKEVGAFDAPGAAIACLRKRFEVSAELGTRPLVFAAALRHHAGMRFIKSVLNFLVSAVVVLVGFYLVISICIVFFKLTGRLSEEHPMYFDMRTPAYAELVSFQAVSIAIIVVCLLLRKRLSPKLGVSGRG